MRNGSLKLSKLKIGKMPYSYIKLDEMKDFCIYLYNARTFSIGIWYKNAMYGICLNLGFIDSERHYDEKSGTCKPLMKLSDSLEDRLTEYDFFSKNWRRNIVLSDILNAVVKLDYIKDLIK